jgi:transcription antitermination protein NusB
MGGAGARRRARGYALQVLYSLDLNSESSADRALAEFWRTFEAGEIDQSAVEFAEQLVRATWTAREEIDEAVKEASRNWRLERMSRVDRNILRLATYELRALPSVPVRVVINEAVELAKRFGADESPAFVNGILDRISQQIRRT